MPSPATAPIPGHELPSLRILVVEDSLVNQKLAVALLKKRGHEVAIASNGREAVAALETETFDVVGTPAPGAELTLVIQRSDGERVDVPVKCRLDTAEEVSVYEAGGVLQRFAQDFLEASKG